MAGLNVAMLNGRTSLLMRQRQLNVAASNLANADRAGYHRQVAEVTTNPAVDDLPGQIGTGARVAQVVRVFDQALETNLQQALQEDGARQAYAGQLGIVEKALAPDGELPLAQAIADFSAALQGVAAEPESPARRSQLLGQASLVADAFNRGDDTLSRAVATLAGTTGRGEVQSRVETVNRLAADVLSLNRQIVQVENRRFNPQHANDLRDLRDEAIGKLAGLIGVTVVSNPDGSATVSVADGGVLVDGTSGVAPISVSLVDGHLSLRWRDRGTPLGGVGGEIQGLIDAHACLTEQLSEWRSYARSWVTTVNDAQAAGFDLTGAAGANWFGLNETTNRMQVLIRQPDRIAAAAVAGASGDGQNALALWSQLHAPAVDDGDSLVTRADRFVGGIAQAVDTAQAAAEGSAAAVSMFREAVGSVSGVNLDEEMLAMLELQRAYQASARFVSIVDELIGMVLQTV